MNKIMIGWLAICCACSTTPATGVKPGPGLLGGTACHWWYGQTTNDEWGPPDWGHCAAECNEKAQSPIDIKNWFPGGEGAITLKWSGSWGFQVSNNGHSIVSTSTPVYPDTLLFAKTSCTLQQFHFHVPAEHLINGVRYPAEAHFVTTDAAGKYFVLGVMLDKGAPEPGDEYYDQIMKTADRGGGAVAITNLTSLLPTKPSGRCPRPELTPRDRAGAGAQPGARPAVEHESATLRVASPGRSA